MYPHIFMHNIDTGSSIIRCECSSKRVPNNETTESKLERCFLDQTIIEQSDEKMLYKNDSTEIEKWSQRVGEFNPQFGLSVPMSLYDHLMALPSPPLTPRKKNRSSASCDSGQLLDIELGKTTTNELVLPVESNVESTKLENKLDLLAGAADFIENNPAYIWYQRSTPRSAEFKNEFADLIMLAEVASKQAKLKV